MIAALARLLERQGAFDRVAQWTLAGDQDHVHIESAAGLRHETRELVDHDGRRLTLVITDCVDIMWRGPAAWAALRDWGNVGPVALVQTLPARLWSATALGAADVRLSAHRCGEPNRQLRLSAPWWWAEDQNPEQAIPVVTLDEQRLASWAYMVAGTGGIEVTGVITQPPEILPGATPDEPSSDPQARVATTRATLSPERAGASRRRDHHRT